MTIDLTKLPKLLAVGTFALFVYTAGNQVCKAEGFILQGEKGDTGKDGAKGDKGDQGNSGLTTTEVNNIKSILGKKSDIEALAAKKADLEALAAKKKELESLAAKESDITALVSSKADIDALTKVKDNLTTLSSLTTDLKALAAIKADVSVVATLAKNVVYNKTDDKLTLSAKNIVVTGDSEFKVGTDTQLSVTKNLVQVSKANLQVVNGEGKTDSTNTFGNLIVGYNKASISKTRTGSHNLIVGDEHSYFNYAGVVFGYKNASLAAYGNVLGGQENKASGAHSSVSGGQGNSADGAHSTILGGHKNQLAAAAKWSTITGTSDLIIPSEKTVSP